MLRELRVRDLGVIGDLALVLGPGMTALTGETGAGKTLLVEAIDLLLGGRADPVLVRPGATEATVEGRFDRPVEDRPDGVGQPAGGPAGVGGAAGGVGPAGGAAPDTDQAGEAEEEVVVARVVPSSGRSRAYVGGRMATLATLGETGRALVDLHGQHAHQSLFAPSAQRAALDRAGGVDLAPWHEARRVLAALDAELRAAGGDERARAREIDLLQFQLAELDDAGLDDPSEDEVLAAEEERLGDAVAHREAAAAVHRALLGDDGALDRVGTAVAAVTGRAPLRDLHDRLRALEAELADVGRDARAAEEGLEADPQRLHEISERRRVLRDLGRKYGDTLTEVVGFRDAARARLAELQRWEERAASLDAERVRADAAVSAAAAAVGAARRAAAPILARSVERELRALAMPRARFSVTVGPGAAGEDVTWLLGANAGEATLPLAKVASGGELARTMLAVRLVLSGVHPSGGDDRSLGRSAPTRTLVFDEVDAGIGGEAAVAVGRALAALARDHQVLVVTHLPQVAAFADQQVAVRKSEAGGRTTTLAEVLDDAARVVELSRMLSGRPDSATARSHATELLDAARRSVRSERAAPSR